MATIYEVHGTDYHATFYYAKLADAMRDAREHANDVGSEVPIIRHVVRPTQASLIWALNSGYLNPEYVEESEVVTVIQPRGRKR